MKKVRSLIGMLVLLAPLPASAQEAAEPENNGTNPALLTTKMEAYYTYTDLRLDHHIHNATFKLTVPLAPANKTSIAVKVPFGATNVTPNRGMGLSDVSVTVTTIPKFTRTDAIALTGEVFFDTADRPELGSGKLMIKPTFIYARFLKNGAIFAPALVHQQSIAGKSNRSDVSVTTVDFYYVPKLKNRSHFITLDPAVNYDWENDAFYPSLAVTAGTKVGNVFGGILQFYVKPSALAGGKRPANWSIETGFRVLNF